MPDDFSMRIKREFAARVRFAIKQSGRSMTSYSAELIRRAKELPDGVSRGTLKNVLNDLHPAGPTVRLGHFLAEDLGVPAGWLLSNEGSSKPTKVFGVPDDLAAWGLEKIDVAAGEKLMRLTDRIALRIQWGTAETLDERNKQIQTVCRSLAAMLLLPRRSPYFKDAPDELYDNAFADALSWLKITDGGADSSLLASLRKLVLDEPASVEPAESETRELPPLVTSSAPDGWECYFCGAADPEEGRKEHLKKHADSVAALPDGVTLAYPNGQVAVRLSVKVAPRDSDDGWDSSADALRWAEDHGQALLEHIKSSVTAGVQDGLQAL